MKFVLICLLFAAVAYGSADDELWETKTDDRLETVINGVSEADEDG
jgi:hypothetical protein